MRISAIIAAAALLSACGRSNEEKLEDAADQSGPVAADVLENAADNGMDPQAALQRAGNAAARASTDVVPPSLQARPNTSENPNPPAAGEPVETVPSNAGE